MADAVGTKAAATEVEKREFADNASVRAAPPAIDPEVNRQLLRKIDWRLMPVVRALVGQYRQLLWPSANILLSPPSYASPTLYRYEADLPKHAL
jgi:hypothetical protein